MKLCDVTRDVMNLEDVCMHGPFPQEMRVAVALHKHTHSANREYADRKQIKVIKVYMLREIGVVDKKLSVPIGLCSHDDLSPICVLRCT